MPEGACLPWAQQAESLDYAAARGLTVWTSLADAPGQPVGCWMSAPTQWAARNWNRRAAVENGSARQALPILAPDTMWETRA